MAVYDRIKYLAKPSCFASTAYLAEKFDVSERQVYRYLDALKVRGLIEVRTVRTFSHEKGRWTSKRLITPVVTETKSTPIIPVDEPAPPKKTVEPKEKAPVKPAPKKEEEEMDEMEKNFHLIEEKLAREKAWATPSPETFHKPFFPILDFDDILPPNKRYD